MVLESQATAVPLLTVHSFKMFWINHFFIIIIYFLFHLKHTHLITFGYRFSFFSSSFFFSFTYQKLLTPPPQGVNLDCCFDPDNFISHIKTKLGACDDNSACAKLGVMGTCCDTTSSQTVQLDCCSDEDNKVGLHTALPLSRFSLLTLFYPQTTINE
jgi:hypothetical protein